MKKINLRFLIARHEMSGLIELRIRRNVPLGDKSQHFSILQYCRHIVELMPDLQRQSHEHKRITARRSIRHHLQCVPRLTKKQLLQEQIPTSITSDAKLRKNDDLRSFSIRLLKPFTDLIRIVHRIRHPNLRGHRRHFDKSMFHELYRLSVFSILRLVFITIRIYQLVFIIMQSSLHSISSAHYAFRECVSVFRARWIFCSSSTVNL